MLGFVTLDPSVSGKKLPVVAFENHLFIKVSASGVIGHTGGIPFPELCFPENEVCDATFLLKPIYPRLSLINIVYSFIYIVYSLICLYKIFMLCTNLYTCGIQVNKLISIPFRDCSE